VELYLVIGVVGLVVLLVSLVVGDVLDGAFDVMGGDWFSSAALGGFVSAFGFGAATADAIGLPTLLTVLVGAVSGVVVAWFALWFTRLVRSGGSDDPVQVSDTVGLDATVLTDIPEGGFGVVRVRVGGHTLQLNARAETAVPVGTDAHVTGVVSPTAVTVAPTWNALS
jgi:membrane protein implicated in regulation of membrane protease activity